MILYGIPNCDTTKKAMLWLKENNITFVFYNYKLQPITKEKIIEWDKKIGWQVFFNKRSTTWKELSITQQNKVVDLPSAIKIIEENNSIVKRPIIEYKNNLIAGFNKDEYQRAFI